MKLAAEGGKPVRENFLPLAKPFIGKEEKEEVIKVLESGWISAGPECKLLEEKLAEYLGVEYVFSVNSCTAGLFLSLLGLGVGKGDEVILPTYTFCSSANVIEHLGAKPVFVDSEPGTMNIDVEEVRKKNSEKTKVIMPVHFAGQPADMDELMSISEENKIPLVEDAAHAIGAEFQEKKIGNWGEVTNFSFYATKNLTTGDGGALVTNNKDLAKEIEILRLHGLSRDAWKRYGKGGNWKYDVISAGYKFNLTDIQAALGVIQLKRLDEFNKQRKKLSEKYRKGLEAFDFIEVPQEKPGRKHVHYLFPIFVRDFERDKLIEILKAENIGTSVHFIPVHSFEYYRNKYKYSEKDFPVAWDYSNREISLPLFNGMTEEDVDDVISAIQKIAENYKL